MRVRAIVLAAGFGTRMGALGVSCPKGLFDLGGVRVMDPILADLDRRPEVHEILWVSNARFAPMYSEWLSERAPATPWRLLDDGATSPEQRLGATGDLALALRESDAGPALVVGSDNLYNFPVTGLATAMTECGHSAVVALREPDADALRSANSIEVSAEGLLLRMVEKPTEPFSDLFVPPVYGYDTAALELVEPYLASGGNPDAPGHFLAWFCRQAPVRVWRPEHGRRLDIGSPEKLEEARRALADGGFGGALGEDRPAEPA